MRTSRSEIATKAKLIILLNNKITSSMRVILWIYFELILTLFPSPVGAVLPLYDELLWICSIDSASTLRTLDFIYFQSICCASTNSIAIFLIIMKGFIFFCIGHHQQSAIFFLFSSRDSAMNRGTCAMTFSFHVLHKICRINMHDNLFPHFDAV